MRHRILRAFAGNPQRVERAASFLMRLVAASVCVLAGATWRLWVPGGEFPRIPLVRSFGGVPVWLQWTALAGFMLGTAVTLVAGRQSRAGRWSAAISVLAFGLLVLVDQQRLQPWAYQLAVLSLVLAWLPAAESIPPGRMLIASIYFFSALSKLDRSFFESGGGQIVDGLLHCLSLADRVGAGGRTALAGLFAAGEMLVAVGLCWRRSRRFAWPASIVMHVLLLAALGPWGANNKPGVLLWNVYFILQNLILFGLAGESLATESERLRRLMDCGTQSKNAPRGSIALRWIVCAIAAFVILFPLTQPFGICDVWPGWAVYTTGPDRLRVFVEASERDRLPTFLKPYVGAPRFEDNLCLVRIDRWSLEACSAPIYPQNRFRLGVALAIAEGSDLGDGILVELDTAAHRLSGERLSRRIRGRDEIVAELNRYWLNGFPSERRGD